MDKLISLFGVFASLRAKLIGLAVMAAVCGYGGWYAHGVWSDHTELASVKDERDTALKAPAIIMKKHQDLRKTNVDKDPCFGTKLPDDVIRLLR